MDRKWFVSALVAGLTLAWAGAAAQAGEQTPSLKIDVGLGYDHVEGAAPFALLCDGFAPPEVPAEPQQDVPAPLPQPMNVPSLITLAVFGFDVQTPPFDWSALQTLASGDAALWQTPSAELAAPRRATPVWVDWITDVNGDAIVDAVFAFSVTDVFDSAEACAAAQGVHFEATLRSETGALVLYGDAAFAASEPAEAPAEPAPASATALSISRAYAMQHGSAGYTFVARGTGIEAVQVEVFSLSGARVFDSGFQRGNTLSWQGLDAAGQRVANGVYLYVITVRGADGQTLRGEVQKLVVLR